MKNCLYPKLKTSRPQALSLTKLSTITVIRIYVSLNSHCNYAQKNYQTVIVTSPLTCTEPKTLALKNHKAVIVATAVYINYKLIVCIGHCVWTSACVLVCGFPLVERLWTQGSKAHPQQSSCNSWHYFPISPPPRHTFRSASKWQFFMTFWPTEFALLTQAMLTPHSNCKTCVERWEYRCFFVLFIHFLSWILSWHHQQKNREIFFQLLQS